MDIVNEIYTTEGRLNRKRYFKYYIILVLVSTIISFIIGFIISLLTGTADNILFDLFTGIVSLATGIGGIMLGVRRLHDLNRNGWFMILLFVPFINLIFLLYLWFAPGTFGDNRFGADPLQS